MCSFDRSRRRFPVPAIACVLLFVVILAQTATARERYPGWQRKPELHLTGIANFARLGSGWASYDTVALTGELTFYSELKPWWGGPFVDYRYSSSDAHDSNLNVGGYLRYNFPRWDATGWLFVNRSPGNEDTWVYATRLRYRLGNGDKLGIESLAPLQRANRPMLMLGYYLGIGESLSLNLLAGRQAGGAPDVAARVEFSWQVY